jgi:hypothetical protein
MTAQLLPDKLTPVSPDEAGRALASAYAAVAGHNVTQPVLNLLLAHWAGETGNGKSVHNYNFGNVKRSDSDPYYQEFREREVVDGKDEYAVRQWAAHLTADEGAAAWLRLLHSRPGWWSALQSGDPKAYVHALKVSPAYYSETEPKYYALVAGLVKRYAAIAAQYARSSSSAGPAILLVLIAVGGVLFLAAHTAAGGSMLVSSAALFGRGNQGGIWLIQG